MSLMSTMIGVAERVPLPDVLVRAAIERMCARTAAALSQQGPATAAEFAVATAERAVAEHADEANRQHYEVPTEFFELVLGPKRKYSCCYYTSLGSTLDRPF